MMLESKRLTALFALCAIALSACGGGEDEAIGALLHDVLEDAAEHASEEITAEWLRGEIRRSFGPRVLEIVEHLTDSIEHPKPSWRERKIKSVADLERAPHHSLLVAAADKFHNLQALIRDFRKEGDALWSRFNPEAGKSGVVGYYRGLADVFARRFPSELSNELGEAVMTLQELTGERGAWPPARAI